MNELSKVERVVVDILYLARTGRRLPDSVRTEEDVKRVLPIRRRRLDHPQAVERPRVK